MNTRRFAIKKTYHAQHPMGGAEAWLRADSDSHQLWTFDRTFARTFATDEAEHLIAEAKRNRPEDVYELVPLN